MQTITTVGLDIAKSVFQVHGVDAQGEVGRRVPLYRRFLRAARPAGFEVFFFAPSGADLRDGMIGSKTKFSWPPPRCKVVLPPKTSSGRSRGSSCRKGPLPVNSFFMFESRPPDPPG